MDQGLAQINNDGILISYCFIIITFDILRVISESFLLVHVFDFHNAALYAIIMILVWIFSIIMYYGIFIFVCVPFSSFSVNP